MRWLPIALLAVGCSSNDQSPPPDGSVSDSGSDASADAPANDASGEASVTSDCVTKINAYRAKVSAPPVASKSTEVACATDQATKGAGDLADSGTTVFHKYFGQCSESFQNECWYSVDDPEAVIDWCLDAFWQEGPPDTGINHYSVMSDPKSTQVACGLFHMPAGGYWMTNDYY